jgi:hypothetical protein
MPQEPSRPRLALAARRVLDRDSTDYVLRPWQAAWLMAVAAGRDGEVPMACGLGRGWLDARMAEALAEVDDPVTADPRVRAD